LPLSMGVEVTESPVPITGAAESLAVIQEPVWPGGDVAPAAGGWVISHAADSAFAALNRLTAGGKTIYWLQRPPDAEGAVGDFYLPAGSIAPEELSRLSRELHLPVRGLERAPTGPAFRVKPVRV